MLVNSELSGFRYQPFFEFSGPTYILDTNFRFIDWNTSFFDLIAKPLKLELGMHVQKFVENLANKDEVFKRVQSLFTLGKTPKVDSEVLIYEHPQYLKIELHKLATQTFEFDGNEKVWVVQLTVGTNSSQYEKVIQLITESLERRTNEDFVAGIIEDCFRPLPSYQDLMRSFVESLFDADVKPERILISGMAHSEIWNHWPKHMCSQITVIENNSMMIELAQQKIIKNNIKNVSFKKQAVDVFSTNLINHFSVVGICDGFVRSSNHKEYIENAQSSLQPKGRLNILTFIEESDPDQIVIEEAYNSLVPKIKEMFALMKSKPNQFHLPKQDVLKAVFSQKKIKLKSWEACLNNQILKVIV